MLVRYLTSEASDTWTREYGQVYELPDEIALAAIAAGKAEMAEPAAPTRPEAATREARVAAVRPSPKGR